MDKWTSIQSPLSYRLPSKSLLSVQQDIKPHSCLLLQLVPSCILVDMNTPTHAYKQAVMWRVESVESDLTAIQMVLWAALRLVQHASRHCPEYPARGGFVAGEFARPTWRLSPLHSEEGHCSTAHLNGADVSEVSILTGLLLVVPLQSP